MVVQCLQPQPRSFCGGDPSVAASYLKSYPFKRVVVVVLVDY
jgi:hypothetical protein